MLINIAIASTLGNRSFCHEYKYPNTKSCERPNCVRMIFPGKHNEGETIGRVIFYHGIMKTPQKGTTIQRSGNVLYVCQLCLLRSQNSYLARQFITDLQEDQACLKATEEASNNDEVIGIASVDIAAMKMKSARPEPNGTRSRTLAQPNAGKTDEDAYKSIVGTISDTAQKHALSSKAINNALPLAIKQKPHTFKQQKPLKLSPKP